MFPIFFIVVVFLTGISLIIFRQLRAARRAEYIRTFTLPPGLYERLQKQRPELELKDCQLVGRGLRQFFLAYQKSGNKFVSMPSQVADDLWHEFILYTKHYNDFCRAAFGDFLHHTPAVVMRSSKQSNAGLRRCWWYVCKEELINPKNPTRLPLLFALDAKFNIADGFRYEANCDAARKLTDPTGGGVVLYCGSDFSDSSIDGGTDGFDSIGDSSDGGSGDSGGDSGGSDSGGGCGGGCGGGGGD